MKRMGRCHVCLMFVCVMTAVWGLTEAAAQEVPIAYCFHAGVPPVIDGRGDDAVWGGAVSLDLVDVADLDRSPHTYPTHGRVLWDNTALYVLIEATDPDVWSTLSNRDDPLYNEEVVELFIDPDGDGRNYMEIEVNPVGTVFDLLVTRALRQGGAVCRHGIRTCRRRCPSTAVSTIRTMWMPHGVWRSPCRGRRCRHRC